MTEAHYFLKVLWQPKEEKADKTKGVLEAGAEEQAPGPPGQCDLSPLRPHREKAFALLFPTQDTCLIQSADDLQDPVPLLVPWP